MVTMDCAHADGNPLTKHSSFDSCCDEGVSLDEPFDETWHAVPDPFRCTLQIRAKQSEVDFLKKQYAPLLEGIDPTFQFIALNEGENVNSPLVVWNDEKPKGSNGGQVLECPAVSVVLFLYEKFGRLSALTVQKTFNYPPWKFHHRVELPHDAKPRVAAKQDFYCTHPEFPLWAICPVHYGNEHLRFHLFVRNFAKMRTFYEAIAGTKSLSSSSSFCCISMYTQRGLDIQLSLKHLPQVNPKPTNAVRLKFKIKDISSLARYLVGPPIPYEGWSWLTSDPDGNFIILHETAPKQSRASQGLYFNGTWDTSDYDTSSGISGDTESLHSSELSPRSSVYINSLEGTLI